MNHSFKKSNPRAAYTLLELLLSLTLSVVVVAAIGSAIQLYLVALTRQQALIERKQIARSVVQLIGSDLRASIQYKAADYSGLENLVQTQTLAVNTVLDDSEDDSSTTDDEIAEPIVDEEEVSFRPALFGTSHSVAVDISRMPRLDEYNPIIADRNASAKSPSDVKSLAYFFSPETQSLDNSVRYASTRAPGGLYRREIDRAVATFNGDIGIVASPDEYCDLLANEVAEIRFRYFDGEGWLTEWDSEENGGFPPAIEVVLIIDPTRTTAGQDYAYSGYDQQAMEMYRSVVHLPAVELPPEEEEEG